MNINGYHLAMNLGIFTAMERNGYHLAMNLAHGQLLSYESMTERTELSRNSRSLGVLVGTVRSSLIIIREGITEGITTETLCSQRALTSPPIVGRSSCVAQLRSYQKPV
jgi:hypothetical protein